MNNLNQSTNLLPKSSPQPNNRSSFSMRKKVDCYLQRFLKFGSVATFHSLSELLHAALLESDPLVTTFTPQPELGAINGKRYIPDCFYIRDGERWVVEIKPGGEFVDNKRIPLEEYAHENGFKFLVVSNEDILQQKIKADNWLRIVRTLVVAEFIDTSGEENVILERLSYEQTLKIGDIVDNGSRISRYHWEVALLRLTHSGAVTMDLEHHQMTLLTRVMLCD